MRKNYSHSLDTQAAFDVARKHYGSHA
jgi:hypothetical protein